MARGRMWLPIWSIVTALLLILSAVQGIEAQAPAAKAAAKLLDLNAATQAELEKLPGVGNVTAKKIIAGRPYTAGGDVAKALEGAGVRKSATAKIVPLVTIGAASTGAAAAAGGSTPATGSSTGATAAGGGAKTGATAKATTGSEAPTMTVAQTPPEKGMVWVNTDSKIYHKEGSAWYGKTKQGKFMSEADAIKAGFRAAKNE